MQITFHTDCRVGGMTCVIKLKRIEKPEELTEERQTELTEEFRKKQGERCLEPALHKTKAID